MQDIKILLIDDDEAFGCLFEENLRLLNPCVNILFKQVLDYNDPLIDQNNQDVYLVDHRFSSRELAPQLVERIKRAGGNHIFVVSKFGNFKLLKELMNLGIEGFIDKDEIDYREFLNFCEQISATKDSIIKINQKLTRMQISKEA